MNEIGELAAVATYLNTDAFNLLTPKGRLLFLWTREKLIAEREAETERQGQT